MRSCHPRPLLSSILHSRDLAQDSYLQHFLWMDQHQGLHLLLVHCSCPPAKQGLSPGQLRKSAKYSGCIRITCGDIIIKASKDIQNCSVQCNVLLLGMPKISHKASFHFLHSGGGRSCRFWRWPTDSFWVFIWVDTILLNITFVDGRANPCIHIWYNSLSCT